MKVEIKSGGVSGDESGGVGGDEEATVTASRNRDGDEDTQKDLQSKQINIPTDEEIGKMPKTKLLNLMHDIHTSKSKYKFRSKSVVKQRESVKSYIKKHNLRNP
jgi:hypothetical protein